MITVKFKSGYIDFQSITRDDSRVYRGVELVFYCPKMNLEYNNARYKEQID